MICTSKRVYLGYAICGIYTYIVRNGIPMCTCMHTYISCYHIGYTISVYHVSHDPISPYRETPYGPFWDPFWVPLLVPLLGVLWVCNDTIIRTYMGTCCVHIMYIHITTSRRTCGTYYVYIVVPHMHVLVLIVCTYYRAPTGHPFGPHNGSIMTPFRYQKG